MAEVIDRAGVLERAGAGVHIDLGCGDRERPADVVGIDARDLPGVDLIGDVFDVLGRVPARCVLSATSSHFMEHIDDLERLMAELGRVMKPGAVLTTTVPHFSNPLYYSDPTHRRFFGLYTFCYLAQDGVGFRRKVPDYGKPPFRLTGVTMDFRNPISDPIQRRVRPALTRWINASTRRQEYYEGNLTGLFSCFDYTATMERTTSGVSVRAAT